MHYGDSRQRIRANISSALNMLRTAAVLVVLAAFPASWSLAEPSAPPDEWRTSGGSNSWDRYSPLDQINRENVANLHAVWHRDALDQTLKDQFPDLTPSNYFRGTPIVVNGVLYAPDGVGLVEAFDAATGQTKWVQHPVKATLKEAAGQSTRGVAYWRKVEDERIISIRGEYLYALDAKAGAPIPEFGESGRVWLDRHAKDHAKYFGFPGPLVVGDVIVVSGNGGGKAGYGYGDVGIEKESGPDNIRGYDVRDGKLLWTFHVMPTKDDPAYKTWGKGSAEYVGNMGAWAPMSADEQLGYVYVPLTAPTTSYYGGHRPGKNLYSDCLVALDARSGKLVWFHQLVHHDLWDYDLSVAPVLGDITVNGKRIHAVFASNKTAFLYVYDRATGRPVWPIKERAVPKSTVPGEESSPTQPFPTKPPAYDRQGFTEDDVIDFTPELHRRALEVVRHYQLGPLFTPPSLRTAGPNGKNGTLEMPGSEGGGNWNTGTFDPDTGIYYAVSWTKPFPSVLAKPTNPEATIDYVIVAIPDAVNGHARPSKAAEQMPGDFSNVSDEGMIRLELDGLPLVKPPYGRITALDLNQGTKLWMVPNGDGPRNHPLLKDLHLPPLGNFGRPAALLTKTLLFVGDGSDAVFGDGVSGPAQLRAYDKVSGQVIAHVDLPVGTTGGPMTYMVAGKQYIVVPVGGDSYGAGWIALAVQ
jgi:glucose dehydrogenase